MLWYYNSLAIVPQPKRLTLTYLSLFVLEPIIFTLIFVDAFLEYGFVKQFDLEVLFSHLNQLILFEPKTYS